MEYKKSTPSPKTLRPARKLHHVSTLFPFFVQSRNRKQKKREAGNDITALRVDVMAVRKAREAGGQLELDL